MFFQFEPLIDIIELRALNLSISSNNEFKRQSNIYIGR